MIRLLTFITCTLLTALPLCATTRAVEDIPNVHRTDSTRHIVDPDNFLSADTRNRLDAIVHNLWQQTSAEMSVVIVDSIASDDIDKFATDLFTEWGIGKTNKDNGLLMLVAVGQRKMAIRTGYGMEGVVPDIVAGRIIRNIAAPHFSNDDIDGGVSESVYALEKVITDPEVRQELQSRYANNSNADIGISADEVLHWWVWLSILVTLVMTGIYLYTLLRTRHRDPYERYHALRELIVPMAVASALSMGMPLVVLLLAYLTMRRVRTKPRICSHCRHKMHRLDEVTDNEYLTPAQDTEERINSVDYDVWLCDNCGETDILPYVNKTANYTVCPRCHARAAALRADRIIVPPTTSRDGYGVKTYICRNCNYSNDVSYKIPRKKEPPIVILPPGGGGSGFGGIGGGSFGGGATGGGGASGGW